MSDLDRSVVEPEVSKTEELALAAQAPEEPRDYLLAVWFVFLMFGVGMLFPWNAFITSADYFTNEFDPFPFTFVMSVAYNFPAVIVLFLSIRFGDLIPAGIRIVGGFTVFLVVMLVVPFVHYLPDVWTHCGSDHCYDILKLAIVLFGILCCGVSSGVTFGATVALATKLPVQYVGATMSGMGVAGVLAGVLGILIKVTSATAYQRNAFIYFSLGAFSMLVSIASYFLLHVLPYSRALLFSKSGLSSNDTNIESPESPNVNSNELISDSESIPLVRPRKSVNYLHMMGRIWPQVFNVFFVFFVTLFLFPGLTLEIESSWSGLSDDWLGVLLVFTFQLFDFVGRTLPRFVIFIPKRLLIFVVSARVIFIGLFIICVRPHWLVSNAWSFGFMVLFAVSNGYCGTLAMMYGPVDAELHEKVPASQVLSFALNFGLFVGVNLALVLLLLVH